MGGMFRKNSSDSSTLMSSTLAIERPFHFTSSVSRLYRLPLHTSHVTYTSGRKCISILICPSPAQASHRPPLTLNENRPGRYPRTLASLVWLNSLRMWSNTPVYVAGLDRGVRPIG